MIHIVKFNIILHNGTHKIIFELKVQGENKSKFQNQNIHEARDLC